MLQTPAPFPHPGSTAMFGGQRWTIAQRNADGTLLLLRPGGRASDNRRATLDELVDATEADRNALLGFTDREAADQRRALWIARHLRDQNSVMFAELHRAVDEAAAEGRLPKVRDGIALAGLLRRLGWRKRKGQHPRNEPAQPWVRAVTPVTPQAQQVAA